MLIFLFAFVARALVLDLWIYYFLHMWVITNVRVEEICKYGLENTSDQYTAESIGKTLIGCRYFKECKCEDVYQ